MAKASFSSNGVLRRPPPIRGPRQDDRQIYATIWASLAQCCASGVFINDLALFQRSLIHQAVDVSKLCQMLRRTDDDVFADRQVA